jgi:hypothetical protein
MFSGSQWDDMVMNAPSLAQQALQGYGQPRLVPAVSSQPQVPVNQQPIQQDLQTRIQTLEEQVKSLKEQMEQKRINKLESGLGALEMLFTKQVVASEPTGSSDTKEGVPTDATSPATVTVKRKPAPPPPPPKK